MSFDIQLTTPITEKDAVGTLIAAKVCGNVVRKGKVIIPNGSVVRGRIRRLERYQATTSLEFIVGIEFTEVEVTGRPLRFYADLLRIDKEPGICPSLSEPAVANSSIGLQALTLHELPGVASFFVDGKAFIVPSGFRMVWRT